MDYSQSDVSQISVRSGYPNWAAHYRPVLMNTNYQTYDINHRDKLYYAMGGNIPVKTKQKVLKLWL
ncbi:MAG: hypothetical protein WBP74_00790, partial [Nitrososphaeraceae archaeon]